MKRILLILIAILLVPKIVDASTKVGNLYYDLNSSSRTASVTYKSSDTSGNFTYVTGKLVIPEMVSYGGQTYSVTSIGNDAFRGCIGLTSVSIPNSVTSIGYGAFYNCSSLKILIFETGEEKLTFGSNSGNIGSYFTNCKIKNLYIGRPISFYGYTDRWEETAPFIGASIESATINSPNICSYLFYGQNDLLNVEFLATITSIYEYAFYGCKSLNDLTIPSSITTIEENAFSNCPRLTTVNSYALEPPTCMSNSFAESPCGYLHVLPQALKAYRTAPVWKEFGSIIGDLGIFIEYNNMLFGLNETDNTAELVMTDDSVTIANIPSSVTKDGKTYSVTSIAQTAFDGCDNLSSVTIPESVTVTYVNCFKELNNLKTITINDGDSQLYIIGEISVPKLEILTLGRELYKGKAQINGEDVECNPKFANISSLTSLNFGKNIRTIVKGMFSGCVNLRSVTIPGNIEFIGDEAFANCVALKSINLEDSESPVTIESATTGAGTGTTFGGDPIETIYLGRNVEYVGTDLSPFKNLETLTTLTIGNKTMRINDYLFYGCRNIEMMSVPSSVTYIGGYSFYDCSTAKLLTISRSVETIGEYAFYNCRGLSTLTIPSSVVTIGDYAFRSCSSLTSISIGDGVKTIGNYAFLDCYMASNIAIGNSVQTIGENAFYNCQSWSNIVIPNSVVAIGANAFALCQGANEITIGSGVKSIGERAFADCDYITQVKCLGSTPPSAYDNTFTTYEATLYVPTNALSSYKTSPCWKNFKTILNDASGIETVTFESEGSCIYTIEGKLINANATKEAIDALAPGIYIIGGKKVMAR